MCALLASPFKTRKPRQFEYKPRHYDPDKEAWEARKRELFGDQTVDEDSKEYHPGQYVQDMRFRRGIMAERQRQKKNRSGLMRLVILFAILGLIAWYMFS